MLKHINIKSIALAVIAIITISISCNNKDISDSNLQKIDSTTITAEQPKKKELDSNKYYVYLTFDDGPLKGSKNINKILLEEKVQGTAFIIGKHYTNSNNDMKKLLDDYKANPYVEVANHSFSHAYNRYSMFYAKPNMVVEDIIKNDSILKFETKSVRFPGRNLWYSGEYKFNPDKKDAEVAGKLLTEQGYSFYGWDIEWHRSKRTGITPAQTLYNEMIKHLEEGKTYKKNHIVLLTHDDMFEKNSEAEKLSELIRLLKQNGNVEFAIVSEYPFHLPDAKKKLKS